MLNPIVIHSEPKNNVEVFNIIHVLDALGLDYSDNPGNWQKLQDWAQANNLDYYAQTRENFNEWEASRNAWRLGYYGVIVVDLS
jgi:predicted DNA binding CopG/RHH family protein